jgi:glycolate oxidase FAD binding subunit
MAKKEGATDTKVLRGEEDRIFWVRVRDFALATEAAVILRANFAISKQAELLGKYEQMAKAAGVECAFIGHAGNGILRCYFLGDTAAKTAAIADLIGFFTAEAVKDGGNLVVEAAPRALKEKVSVWGESRSDIVVMRRLKEKVDPAGVLNPGRFVGGI